MSLSLEKLAIESRKDHIHKKLEDIEYFIDDIKEKTKKISMYVSDSDNIYQQIYTNMISYYDMYNEQLSQLDDVNILNQIGVVQLIVYQKTNEKKFKKEMKEYIKMFYELYSQIKELYKLPLSD